MLASIVRLISQVPVHVEHVNSVHHVYIGVSMAMFHQKHQTLTERKHLFDGVELALAHKQQGRK
jgi:hypothetical protein